MKSRYLEIILAIALVGIAAPRSLVGEEEPTPGVARVSLIHGDVSSMRGDSEDWVAATVNAPLVRGDKVSTGERSRTEIQLDYANILRLGPRTEAKLADLTRTHIQIQIAGGLANMTVFEGSEADVEIDTPNVAMRPLREGSYRIEVNSPSETILTVRNGRAEVFTPQGSTVVEKNQTITVRGTDNPEYQTTRATRLDDWDEWNRDRDRYVRDAGSWRYAQRRYAGAHELDCCGRWVYVPGYEWCWTPYVNFGWVPYRYGRWLWEPYWGWTWMSYEPWGWAPYHYGRWFWYANSWYWWPGYHVYGAAWAPAYVSFIGFGFGGYRWHFGLGFGFGSIGWLPLGPYDAYYPWHGYHNTYNVVNITNITNIRNVTNVTNGGYRGGRHGPYGSNLDAALSDARVRSALTTATVDDFVRGRVPRNPQALDASALRRGQLVQGTLPAVPTRESMRPTDRVVNRTAWGVRGNQPERFFTRRQPPTALPSFNERAAQIQEMVRSHNPLQAPAQGTSTRDMTLAARNNANPAPSAGRGVRTRPGEAAGSAPAETAHTAAARVAPQVGAGNETGRARAGAVNRTASPSSALTGADAEAGEVGRIEPQVSKEQRAGGRHVAQPGARGEQPAPSQAVEKATTSGRIQSTPSRISPRAAGSAQPDRAGREPQPSGASTGRGAGSDTRTPWPAAVNLTEHGRSEPALGRTPGGSESATGPAGWRRFSGAAAHRQAGGSTPVTREARTSGAPASFHTAPATPAGDSDNRGGWRRFAGRSAAAPPSEQGRWFEPARPQSTAEGWRRFPSERDQAPATRGEESIRSRSYSRPSWPALGGQSPRGYSRPPLEIRKPIMTERAPRTSQGGGTGVFPGGGQSGRSAGSRGSSRSSPGFAPRQGRSRSFSRR